MRNEFDRFIEKVNKTDSCWEWKACKYRGGYGQFRRLIEGKWTMAKAHRYSYEYYKGPIPSGFLICHLFIGSHKDNMKDCIQKGRKKIGRNQKHRLLSKEVADQIRQDHKNGLSYNDLQEKYKQSKQQISRVVRGDIWK
jgi:hypothetical protein